MSEVQTSGVDLLVIAYRGLSPAEQEEALDRCHQLWLEAKAGQDSEAARMINSLKRAADILGDAPGIEAYKHVRRELLEDGEELEPSSRILRHFNGSWHLAKEALDLSQVTTPKRIEARFRSRRLGKVWRYREETLRDTMERAAEDIGHAPQVAEFDWWRDRQLELATARGDDLQLPSPASYRRRYGGWEKSLLHFGYTPDELAERLERK